jgi:DNA-binding MarR family transcriptional regulator
MDQYVSNNQNRDNFFEPPPVLIAADSESGKVRARQTVAMAGLRVADAVDIAEARDRIRQQAAASALWVELDSDFEPATDALLDYITADVSERRCWAIVAAPAAFLDRLSSHAFDPNVNVILDAGESERAAALAVAVSGVVKLERVADVTADRNAVRLRQLSDEVSRIASTLARLSTGPAANPRPIEIDISGAAPDVSMETIRAIIRARRMRSRYFDDELFADPAWDMLLDLLQAEITKLRVPVSSLCIAASVPATTALRWLKTMVQQGLFLRSADPHDGRRVFVELAPQTSLAIRRYFADVSPTAVI